MNKTVKSAQYQSFLKKRGTEMYNPPLKLYVPLPPFPKDILIEVTNRCNHACVFCSNRKMTRKKGSIDKQLLVSVLTQAFLLGAKDVGFYATGEPLMYKEIDYAVKVAKKIGYEYIYITTNGALAKLHKIKQLIESGLDSIKFSINAASRHTYRTIHGRDDYTLVLGNLISVKKYRDEYDIPLRIGVTYVITDSNRFEIQYAKDVFSELADDVGFFEEGNQGGYMSENGKPSNVQLPCSMLFNRFHVSYEGYYTLCCVDYQNYLAVADLNRVTLDDAWTSPLAVEMRRRHMVSNVDGTLCHNCVECKSDPVDPLIPEYATLFCFQSDLCEHFTQNM